MLVFGSVVGAQRAVDLKEVVAVYMVGQEHGVDYIAPQTEEELGELRALLAQVSAVNSTELLDAIEELVGSTRIPYVEHMSPVYEDGKWLVSPEELVEDEVARAGRPSAKEPINWDAADDDETSGIVQSEPGGPKLCY